MARNSSILSALVVAAAVATPSLASAQVSQIGRGRNIGLGVVLGWPNVGLGLNAFLNERYSVQLGLTWSYRSSHGYFGLRGDFLFWMPRIMSSESLDLRWYLGPGLNVGMVNGLYDRPDGRHPADGSYFLEGEVPIGIALQFKFPLDVAIEAIPRFYLYDSSLGAYLGVSVAAAVNVRYYF